MKKLYFISLAAFCVLTVAHGQTWDSIQSFPDKNFSMFFTSDDTGFVVGMNGKTYKTFDGGNAWSVMTLPNNSNSLLFVTFVNKDTGYISDYNNCSILKTTDGGITWTIKNSIGGGYIWSMDFQNNGSIGYALQSIPFFNKGYLIKSTDGGETWTTASTLLFPQNYAGSSLMRGLDFPNANIGYAIADMSPQINGFVFKTTDGGSSWNIINTGYNGDYQSNDICFVDQNMGFYVTSENSCIWPSPCGRILRTKDGGATWDTTIFQEGMYSVFFISPAIGYAGGEGSIYKTMDGGDSWNVEASIGDIISDLFFPSANIGYALGWNTLSGSGSILKLGGNSSIEENEKNNYWISIYPNPFSTQTTLQTDDFLHNATLTINNCFGQTVVQVKNISGQTITFNRDNLPSGLYFLRLTEGNTTLAADKLIIVDN